MKRLNPTNDHRPDKRRDGDSCTTDRQHMFTSFRFVKATTQQRRMIRVFVMRSWSRAYCRGGAGWFEQPFKYFLSTCHFGTRLLTYSFIIIYGHDYGSSWCHQHDFALSFHFHFHFFFMGKINFNCCDFNRPQVHPSVHENQFASFFPFPFSFLKSSFYCRGSLIYIY